jgi:hypothetical protein
VDDALDLLATINGIGAEGLFAADYQPDALRAAINAGAGDALDEQASRSFAWLAEDLRDGRTPMTARVQWFAVDPDQDDTPTQALLDRATANHDVSGTLAGLGLPRLRRAEGRAGRHAQATARRDAIRINMDRWRWLPRDLGSIYLITNVPEFAAPGGERQADPHLSHHRGQAGPHRHAATGRKGGSGGVQPHLDRAAIHRGGRRLGAKLLARPRAGYKVTRNGDGSLTVVQQPGDTNSLGRMKIDMPNPHAIYLHDTPSKALFNAQMRAFSHGCIRTERAVELGMTMAMLGAGISQQDAVAFFRSQKYTAW